MKSSTFGMLVASAVAGLVATPVLAAEGGSETKGCYRQHCGKSVTGHEGKCGGTKVDAITDQKACETAGGAWTTEKDAAKYAGKGS